MPAPPRGGRTEALRLLDSYDPAGYGKGRNNLDGPVSRLSPYLRHGMIGAPEVLARLRERFPGQPERLAEFTRQLAWRDFFSKVLAWHGRGLEDDIEEPKHGVARDPRMPLDIIKGETGLPCVDGMVGELCQTGYLHNHARLWFAAYWCHFRGLDWRQGARLFRRLLLDGDTASNFSSWQWVEGTFASKPYFMNRENIEGFSGGRWCRGCRTACPFDKSYTDLQRILFGGSLAPLAGRGGNAVEPVSPAPGPEPEPNMSASAEIVWVHDGAMSWESPAVAAKPSAPLVFAFDTAAMRAEPPARHRVEFVLDGIEDLFARAPNPAGAVLAGDLAESVGRAARAAGASTVHLERSAEPAVAEAVAELRERFRVVEHEAPELARYADEPRRFSRYWDKVGPALTGLPARGGRWHK